jgi:hypothetical protein
MRQVIAVLLFVSLLFFTNANFLYAQVKATDAAITISEIPLQETSEETNNDYVLAFPGILPDNPLYILKAIRDRIIEFLINNPIKKAEYSLLTSDKRFYASKLLAEKGKDDLAISTLSKSNNYFDKVITLTESARGRGENVDTVLYNLNPALKEREEMLPIIEDLIDKSNRGRVILEANRLEEFKKRANELISN